MQRLTISIDDDLAQAFDALIEKRGYQNRSEAFRDLLRKELAGETLSQEEGECVAVVSYSIDHHKRSLPFRMTEHHHDHSNLVISTMHVHANATDCVEAVVMRGPIAEVQALAKATIAEIGVEHGFAHFIPIEGDHHHHHHE
jgi:CopG family nickel-responsive transcriptional regulator